MATTAVRTPQETASSSSKGGLLSRLRSISSRPSTSLSSQSVPTKRTLQPDLPTTQARRLSLFGPLPTVSKSQAEHGYIPVHREQRTAALRAAGLKPTMTLSEMEQEMDVKYARLVSEPLPEQKSVGVSKTSGEESGKPAAGSVEDSESEAQMIRGAWLTRHKSGDKENTERIVEEDENEQVEVEVEPEPLTYKAQENGSRTSKQNAEKNASDFPPCPTAAATLPCPDPQDQALVRRPLLPVLIVSHERAESQTAEVETWSDRHRSDTSSSVLVQSPSGSSDSTCTFSDLPQTPMLPATQADVARIRSPSNEARHGYQMTAISDSIPESTVDAVKAEFGGLAEPKVRPRARTAVSLPSSQPVHAPASQRRYSIFGGRGSNSAKTQQTLPLPPPPPRQPRPRKSFPSFGSFGSKLGIRPKTVYIESSPPLPSFLPSEKLTPAVRPRPSQTLSVSPTMHNRASMVVMAERIEDEETRRLTEAAFLDF
ncbi:hypothetical protein BC835DRAFT_1420746 [Cytidiella melzeri]|nr:hypothetical protein BC835DRAFT_1420746 [Cytidiella melzeri]